MSLVLRCDTLDEIVSSRRSPRPIGGPQVAAHSPFVERRLMIRRTIGFAVLLALICGPRVATAQGLIWKLPPEGTWVKYSGSYNQEDDRPEDATQKKLKLTERRRHLEIKALKKVTADYNGKPTGCQWLEFIVTTGLEVDGMLEAGPGARRVYKVLVPIERATIGGPVDGSVVDKDKIPVQYLPIVKGYRRFGERDVQPIKSGVLHVYPLISLLAHYRNLETVAEAEDPQVDLQDVTTAKHYKGELLMESRDNRSTNAAELWASDKAPFGLVRWKVDIVREAKDISESRDKFTKVSTFSTEMRAVEMATDATSELEEE